MNRSVSARVVAASLAGALTAAALDARTNASLGSQTGFAVRTATGQTLRYLLFLPRDYDRAREPWPLILYLHGRSRRGNDLNRLRAFSLPAVLDNKPDFPFVVVSPQCPSSQVWTDVRGIGDLLDSVAQEYRVDPERIYLTGHSMGGSGVWFVAQQLQERFAAIAPVSAGRVPSAWAHRVGGVPVWILHGSEDSQTPLRYAEEMAEALRAAGHAPQMTVLRGEGHDILHVFNESALFNWFLSHRRSGVAAEPFDPR